MRKVKRMKLDEDVLEDDYLDLTTGDSVKNIPELIGALDGMTDEEFSHHVSKNHNDIEDWIFEAYSEEELAKRVKKIRKRKKMSLFLQKVLEEERENVGSVQKVVCLRKKKDILAEIGSVKDEM